MAFQGDGQIKQKTDPFKFLKMHVQLTALNNYLKQTTKHQKIRTGIST
jgi:hypothetical protein